MRRRAEGVLALTILAFVGVASGQDGGAAPDYPAGPPGIWAQVGDRAISEAECKELRKKSGDRLPVDVALDTRILEEVLNASAERAGVTVTDEEIDAKVAEAEERAVKGNFNLAKRLEAEGIDASTFRRSLRFRLLMDKFLEREMSDEGLKAHYEANRDRYLQQVRVARIVIVPREGEGPAQTRERAEAALARARSSEDWAVVARALSDDPLAPFDAGDLGWIYPEQRKSDPVIQAARALKPGEVCDRIVVSQQLSFIVKLSEVRTPELPLEEAPRRELIESEYRFACIKRVQERFLKETTIIRYRGAPGPSELFPN